MKNKEKIFNHFIIFIFGLAALLPLIVSLTIFHYTLAPIDPVTNTSSPIDLSKNNYQLHWRLQLARGYKGTYYKKLAGKNDRKEVAVKRLTNAFYSEIIDNDPINSKIPAEFKNYADLTKILNGTKLAADITKIINNYKIDKTNYFLNSSKIIKKKQPLTLATTNDNDLASNTTRNFLNYPAATSYETQVKQLFLFFYNFVTKTFSKKDVKNILFSIESVLEFPEEYKDAEGITIAPENFWMSEEAPKIQVFLKKNTFSHNYKHIATDTWKAGFWSTSNIYQVLIHELGHVINNWISFKLHDPIIIFQKLQLFLKSKINNLYLFPELDETTILNTFAASAYSLKNRNELFAEIFAYWVLTPNELKTKAWQLANDFFTSLPQILAKNEQANTNKEKVINKQALLLWKYSQAIIHNNYFKKEPKKQVWFVAFVKS